MSTAFKTGEQIVQDLPWRWGVQGKIFIIGGIGYMFDAWDVALNGFLTPLVGLAFELTKSAAGWVATANLIGMAVGAVFWGTIADRVGRKKAFSVTILIFALFSLLGAFSPNYAVFLVMRFIAGFGLGGCIPVDYALVGEFSPRKVRGRVLTALDMWWPIGATFAGVASLALLSVPQEWRWMMGLMVLPALLTTVARRGIPESPIYLASQGREKQARAVIDDLVKRTGTRVEPYRIVPPQGDDRAPQRFSAAVQQFTRLWREFPKITLISWLLFVSIMVVYYAAQSWMPTLLKDAGMTQNVSFVGATIMNSAGILGCAGAAWLVEKVGRKALLAVTAPLAGVALVVFGLVIDNQVLAFIMLCAFGLFILATIPVLYAYVAELYPTYVRATGFAWASSVSRAATGVAPIIFGSIMWPLLGVPLTFGVLTMAVIFAVALMLKFGPETAGRGLDESVASPSAAGGSPL